MKSLIKSITALSLILMLTVSVQAQNFYAASDIGAGGQAIERIEAGIYLHTSEQLNISAGWGYASRFNSGNYATFGFTSELMPNSLSFSIGSLQLQPLLSLNTRGAIGEIPQAGSVARKDLSGGFAYSALIGFDFGPVAAGMQLEQWVSNRDYIYVNPLSIRYKF